MATCSFARERNKTQLRKIAWADASDSGNVDGGGGPDGDSGGDGGGHGDSLGPGGGDGGGGGGDSDGLDAIASMLRPIHGQCE